MKLTVLSCQAPDDHGVELLHLQGKGHGSGGKWYFRSDQWRITVRYSRLEMMKIISAFQSMATRLIHVAEREIKIKCPVNFLCLFLYVCLLFSCYSVKRITFLQFSNMK